MTNEELLTKLEQVRKAHGLNVTTFSKLLGMSDQSYYDWRNGKESRMISTLVTFINFCKEENLL